MELRHESSGWVRVLRLPGWESHVVRVRAAVVDGEPRVTSLQLTPRAGADPALASSRLRSLPLRQIARAAMPTSAEDMWAALGEVGKGQPPPRDPRALVSVEQFAEAWRVAVESPAPTRAAVCSALHIGKRTYDRYRRKALDQGLITEREAGK